MHASLGGYEISDLEIVSAFDVARAKVGRDVSDAIYAAPNNTHRFAEPPPTGIRVSRGKTLDGLGKYISQHVTESDEPECNVAAALEETATEVLVSYLPVGSQRAAEFYAEEALKARCAFINCMPVFIASKPEWRARFADRGVPIIGDDVKSQVGATIVHRVLQTFSRNAASAWIEPISSISAGTPISKTCWSAIGSNRRRSQRRSRS